MPKCENFGQITISIAIAILLGGLYLYSGAKYIFSDFLMREDVHWIVGYMNGDFLYLPQYLLFHGSLFLLGYFGSPEIIKIGLIGLHCATAVIGFQILARFSVPLYSALAIGAIFSFPVFPHLGIFALGSHMIMGTFFAFCAVYMLMDIRHSLDLIKPRLQILFALALLFASAISSPIFTLAPFLATIASGIRALSLRTKEALATMVMCFTATIIFIFASRRTGGHVYGNLEGWTNYTIQNAIKNLIWFVRRIMDAYTYSPTISKILYVGALTTIICLALISLKRLGQKSQLPKFTESFRHFSRLSERISEKSFCSVLLFSLAVMTLVPSLIVTYYPDRYSFAPLLAALVALAVATAHSGESISRTLKYALLALLTSNVLSLPSAVAREVEGYYAAHIKIRGAVQALSPQWRAGDQVLLLVPKDWKNPAHAYNHWSKTYINYLAGSKNLSGLVGAPEIANGYLFQPKGGSNRKKQNMTTIRGKRQRTLMTGLDDGLPLKTYRLDDVGTVSPVDTLVVYDKGGFRTIAHGQIPSEAPMIDGKDSLVCNRASQIRSFLWPTSDPSIDFNEWSRGANKQLQVGNINKTKIDLQSGIPTRISFRFGRVAHCKASKPCPLETGHKPILRTPAFEIEGNSSALGITDVLSRETVRTQVAKPLALEMIGVEGCFFGMRLDNRFVHKLKSSTLAGDWTWGTSEWSDRVTEVGLTTD